MAIRDRVGLGLITGLGSSLAARRSVVGGKMTDLTLFGNFASTGVNCTFSGGALAGTACCRMLAMLFAFVNRGLAGARNAFRSRKLGELRLRRGLGGTAGLAEIEAGTLFDDISRDDAKGSAGRCGWELDPKATPSAEGGERGELEYMLHVVSR